MPNYILTNVRALPGYKLELSYAHGEKRIFDASPYLRGSWYGQLKTPFYFQGVHVVADGAGIAWEGGQDIAPHELYDMSVEAY
jgi:hypothetical protein